MKTIFQGRRQVKVGFSWTIFFGGGLVLLSRGMLKHFLIFSVFVVTIFAIAFLLSSGLVPFFGNSFWFLNINPLIVIGLFFLLFLVVHLFYGLKGNAFYVENLLVRGYRAADEATEHYLEHKTPLIKKQPLVFRGEEECSHKFSWLFLIFASYRLLYKGMVAYFFLYTFLFSFLMYINPLFGALILRMVVAMVGDTLHFKHLLDHNHKIVENGVSNN